MNTDIQLNELNAPLGQNNTPSSFNPLNSPDFNQIGNNIKSGGSQEKILHLQRGYKVWYKICTLFGISVLLLIISIIVSAASSMPQFLFLMIPSGIGILIVLVCLTCCNGFVVVNPNEAVVFQYYGRYLGTIKENGYFYGYPLATKQRVSLRSNQYNGNRLKVNERDGNPVELGIVVVWRIGDTAKAIFDVIRYEEFIHTQSEAAIRFVGCKYPYEPLVPGEVSLRGGQEIINKELRQELEKRVKISGIIIEDARVTEISYGPEVARMMLQKQASNATVYAKDALVRGAAKAVLNTLNEFEKNGIQFKEEEKSKYITGLMTTLCMSSDFSKTEGN